MEKIINFFKEKYKIFIPIMVVLVLLIAVFFLYREYKYDNYRDKKEVAVYQYFAGKKKEYTAIITYNLKKVIVSVEGKDKKINYDSTPIYYQDEDMILFPNEMTIVFPLRSGIAYRLYKYTSYGIKDRVHKIISGNESDTYNHFFLYDGKGLYFFADKVPLKIDDKDYVELSPNSYVHIAGDYNLVYYDRENDKSEVLDIYGMKITATNDDVVVDLTDGAFYLYGKRALINQPSSLNPLLGNWQIKEDNDIIKFRIGVL